jgi:C4-type Zn-finger protein
LEEHNRQRQCDEIIEEETLMEAPSCDTPELDTSVQSSPSKSKCEARYADGFPLQTLQEVIDLDNQMGEEEEVKNRVERFLEMNKEYARERFTRAFSLFVTDECLNAMTWTGHREKFEFRSLKNIVDALWREYNE